ncbi:hypothetical protein D9Q98_004725 [Chlorella vulgaris]|uniref:Transmembrane protein n=1 Tax=Chlorella vulgaris TaxID=3077 RepID=A0A9D4TRJ1_CHLVU|nr:hypothetical protein D9Q98_004725 [Chlorella vulgaris]
MPQPRMQPLLGRDGTGKRPSLLGVVEAVLLIALLLLGFWHGVHALQVEIHVHPVLIGVFPLFGAAALLLLLPPILYLSFRQEFGALHPMWPPHYLFLVRRLLRALSGNKQLKVTAKEL